MRHASTRSLRVATLPLATCTAHRLATDAGEPMDHGFLLNNQFSVLSLATRLAREAQVRKGVVMWD